MYCVIQKIKNKKSDPYGAYKDLKVTWTSWVINNVTSTKYSYFCTGDKFERPIKDAYKISIHKSYRENGKVKKKQWVICTMSYYDLVDRSTWIGEYTLGLDDKLQQIGITEDELCELVYKKLQPIIDTLKAEFETTEEYKTKRKHDEIIKKYREVKEEFEKKYGNDTYDYCYDVFGTLRNEKYLKELESIYQANKTYRENYSSYYNNGQSTYNDYDFSSYFETNVSTYTDTEKEYLKAIYKAAAMKLHPDIKKDNGEGMKFLNKLKDQWKI